MGTLLSIQLNCKEKNILGSLKNLSKDDYTTTIYLSETNFKKIHTKLSKEIWQTKKNWRNSRNWRIIRKCPPYNYNTRKCYLCLNKKLEIALYEAEHLLSKKRKQGHLQMLSSKQVHVYAS